MQEPVWIQSEKIVLRDYVADDLEAYERWNRPGHLWQKMDAPYLRRSNDLAEHGRFILEDHIRSGELPTPRRRLALSLPRSPMLIGAVSSMWESPESGWLSAGISIYDEKLWRQGLGADALTMWTDYLFQETPDIVRLDVRTWSGNRGMIALAEKCGFRQEACLRRARRVDGDFYDALVFGMLQNEWQTRFLARDA